MRYTIFLASFVVICSLLTACAIHNGLSEVNRICGGTFTEIKPDGSRVTHSGECRP